MQWVICAPAYSPDSGGSICLHTLADVLAGLGHEVYIAPIYGDEVCSPLDLKTLTKVWRRLLFYRSKKLPLAPGSRAIGISISQAFTLARQGAAFLYPELVWGNPYQAQTVVRWLLHFPMYWRKAVHWNAGDLVVRFGDGASRQQLTGIHFLDVNLKIVRYPWQLYHAAARPTLERCSVAYLVRKGKGKPFVHPKNSICVDGLSHEQTAEVLGRCHTFYSYDLYTAYSQLAVVAGCQSIVVPDRNVSLETWYPNPMDRYGIAYGTEQLTWSQQTSALVLQRLQAEEANNTHVAAAFIDAVNAHLSETRK